MNDAEVVIIEDNPYDAELIVRCLRQNRLLGKLVILEDGEMALDYVFSRGPYADRKLTDMPIVILLDLKIPLVSGLEVLKQIKSNERTRKIPVIIVSSSKEESDIITAYNYGANSYIVKPVDFGEFNDKINLIGLYWLSANERPV